ncbi:MAG: hypothetical protein JRN08_07105, partial [Nitrososphaerota archaeon]|nr:hypothetical protein [Nitrososphaerota archaeon]
MRQVRMTRMGVASGVGLVMALLLLSGIPLRTTSASSAPPYEAQGFTVINTFWGSAAAQTEASPGDSGVPLTLTLQYTYPFYESVSTQATLNFTGTSFTGSDGGPNATEFYYGTLHPGDTFQLTFYVDVGAGTSLGYHTIPVTFLWDAILTNSSAEPQTSLTQNTNVTVLVAGDVSLGVQADQTYLTPGEVNYVSFNLTNSGTLAATDVKTTVSSSQGVASISALPTLPSLAPGSSFVSTIEVYVAGSAAGSTATLTLSTAYSNEYGVAGSSVEALTFIVESADAGAPVLIVSQANDTVVVGKASAVLFTVKNVGNGTAYFPQYMLSASSPLVSFGVKAQDQSELVPGQTVEVEAVLSASTSSTPGTAASRRAASAARGPKATCWTAKPSRPRRRSVASRRVGSREERTRTVAPGRRTVGRPDSSSSNGAEGTELSRASRSPSRP